MYIEQALIWDRQVGDRREEGYALSYLGRAHATGTDLAHAGNLFEQAVAIFDAIGDRRGEAECSWHFGLCLVRQGERERALPLLRAAIAYEQEIGHAKAAEHAAFLARLEAGEDLTGELLHPAVQPVAGEVDDP